MSSFSWSNKCKIYPLESAMDDYGICSMREALIGHTYSYVGKRPTNQGGMVLDKNNPGIPYGTILGVLTYKRFREPVIYDPTRFVGTYVCKFTNFNGAFEPDELLRKVGKT